MAAYLQRLADASSLSLSQIADKMDCTRSYVWQLLNQEGSNHSVEQYVALAQVLGRRLEFTTSYEFHLMGDDDD